MHCDPEDSADRPRSKHGEEVPSLRGKTDVTQADGRVTRVPQEVLSESLVKEFPLPRRVRESPRKEQRVKVESASLSPPP